MKAKEMDDENPSNSPRCDHDLNERKVKVKTKKVKVKVGLFESKRNGR